MFRKYRFGGVLMNSESVGQVGKAEAYFTFKDDIENSLLFVGGLYNCTNVQKFCGLANI
jgi:hypothetical protein